MKIIHVSAECYPIAKIGGLADVVGALPKYQQDKNTISEVIMPLYDNTFTNDNSFETIFNSQIIFGESTVNYSIVKLEDSTLQFPVYCVNIPDYLYKTYVYSNDDVDRFLLFQIAALDWILTLQQKPNVIHCHDHHTGLIPFMLQECFKYKELNTIPVVTTIHNAQYQGWFGYDKLHLIPKFNLDNIGLLDWDNCINPLATAIKCAWRVTTVSPTYMEELKVEANGLQHLLNHESKKCVGILNGIDTTVWNPETDNFLNYNYNISNLEKGKAANKEALCKQFNLDYDKPLFAFIGRLVGEKGADVLPFALEKALENNDCCVIVLGSGFENIQNHLSFLKSKYEGRYNVFIGYDEALSHQIYASADFLLMPSRVEPCGLNQLYALRYGTIPIVRNVGGLKDTVKDISQLNGFGICHNHVSVDNIYNAMLRGINLFDKTTTFKSIRKLIMQKDHSWFVSAKAYKTLYKSIK